MRFSSHGFTLIEMILTIAIISTISASSYFAFIKFNQSKDLGIAHDDFANTISEAKADTLSQITQTIGSTKYCTAATQTLVGYQISINTATTPDTYSLQIVCSDSGGNHATTIKTKALPNSVGVSLSKFDGTSTTSVTTVLFLAPSALLDATYSATLTANGVTKTVGVDPNGVVSQ